MTLIDVHLLSSSFLSRPNRANNSTAVYLDSKEAEFDLAGKKLTLRLAPIIPHSNNGGNSNNNVNSAAIVSTASNSNDNDITLNVEIPKMMSGNKDNLCLNYLIVLAILVLYPLPCLTLYPETLPSMK